MRRLSAGSAVLLGAVLVLGALPLWYFSTSSAATDLGTYGSQVATSSTDFKPTLYRIASDDFVGRTNLGDTTTATDDAFYLLVDAAPHPTTVETNSVRLVPPSGFSYGTFVVGGNSDDTVGWTQFDDANAPPLDDDFDSNVKYLETDGKPGYTDGDMVYWDAPAEDGCAGNGAVSICDIRLSSGTINGITYTAGTQVTSTSQAEVTEAGDADGVYPISTTLTAGFELWYFDANGNFAADSGDTLYLKPTAALGAPAQTGAVVPITNSVRLTAFGSHSAGTKTAKGDSDIIPTLEAYAGIDCAAMAKDGSTDPATYKIFLHYDTNCLGAPTTIQMNDLVLFSGAASSGTIVSSTSNGYGLTIDDRFTPFSANLFSVDANSNGAYDASDPVYWNRPSNGQWGGTAAAAAVSEYDLRLTSVTAGSSTFSAGTVVAVGATDISTFSASTIFSSGWVLKFFDSDWSSAVPVLALSNARVSGADGLWATAGEDVYVSSDGTVGDGDYRVYNDALAESPTTAIDCPGPADCDVVLQTLTNARVTGPDGTWGATTEYVYVSEDDWVNNADKRVYNDAGLTESPTTLIANADADVTGSSLSSNDQIYLSRIAVGTISIPVRNDVRLMSSFGDRVSTSSSSEWVPRLLTPTAADLNAARWDINDPGSVIDDVIYMNGVVGTTTIVNGAVRLVGLDNSKPAGSQVSTGQTDSGQTVSEDCATGIAACIGFVNTGGTAYLETNDIVYLDTDPLSGSPGAAGFSQFDVRLNSYTFSSQSRTAGTLVSTSDNDHTSFVGTALAEPACRDIVVKFWDDNSDGIYNVGDTVYLVFDTDSGDCNAGAVVTAGVVSSAIPRLLDVRMSGSGGPISPTGGAQSTPAAVLPSLSNPTVSAECVASGASVTFTAKYTDSLNRAPTVNKLTLNAVDRTMTTSATTYSAGVTYTVAATAPTASANYTGTFTFTNAGGTATLAAPRIYVMPTTNVAPILSGAGVAPTSGSASTSFTWSVSYLDPNNAAPTVKKVIIDGVAHNLTSTDTTYCDGATFTYQQTLAVGSHTYSFEFSDGTTTVKTPTTGTSVGPTVTASGSASPTNETTNGTTGSPAPKKKPTPGFEMFVGAGAVAAAVILLRRRRTE